MSAGGPNTKGIYTEPIKAAIVNFPTQIKLDFD